MVHKVLNASTAFKFHKLHNSLSLESYNTFLSQSLHLRLWHSIFQLPHVTQVTTVSILGFLYLFVLDAGRRERGVTCNRTHICTDKTL